MKVMYASAYTMMARVLKPPWSRGLDCWQLPLALYVEQDSASVKLMEAICESVHCQAKACPSLELAVTCMESLQPRIVLVNLDCPGVDLQGLRGLFQLLDRSEVLHVLTLAHVSTRIDQFEPLAVPPNMRQTHLDTPGHTWTHPLTSQRSCRS